jgi:hypothetical protein
MQGGPILKQCKSGSLHKHTYAQGLGLPDTTPSSGVQNWQCGASISPRPPERCPAVIGEA